MDFGGIGVGSKVLFLILVGLGYTDVLICENSPISTLFYSYISLCIFLLSRESLLK